jgi:hypothetical protein
MNKEKIEVVIYGALCMIGFKIYQGIFEFNSSKILKLQSEIEYKKKILDDINKQKEN